MVVESIPRQTRAVYVTPSHQYPLGVAMTLPRRRALLAWARRHRAAIIEDDYDSEFRFGGRPLEPLQTLDRGGRVIYVGSFSKTLLPGLRLGFIVVPRSIRAAVQKAKSVTDWHSSMLEQVALAEFIDEGAFASHLRRVSTVYRERHDLIATILRRDFAGHVEVVPSSTGLHLTAVAREATVDQIAAVARRARAADVGFHELSYFAVTGPTRAGVVLGYGGIPTSRIREGLRRVRDAFRPL